MPEKLHRKESIPTNERIAKVLEQIADLLEAQDANPFRVRAYRNGAQTVREAQDSVAKRARKEGREALQSLPGIGEGLSGVITELVHTRRSSLLARLQGEVAPEDLFAQLPGIGDTLAERIATELDVDTLEELEQAAYDGRLEKVEGFGPTRVRSIRTSLAGILSRAAQRRIQRGISGDEDKGDAPAQVEAPQVDTLLQVDAEYRRRAEAGELQKITPKRFNPEREAWLPIMHTERREWEFTALYSNTARAHDLGTTHDWVVIYYQRDGHEGQATVVTEKSGPLKGKRVVRGREQASRRYYAHHDVNENGQDRVKGPNIQKDVPAGKTFDLTSAPQIGDDLFGDICTPERGVNLQTLRQVLTLAVELAREGREGRKVGTMFVISDSEEVLCRSKPLILDPLWYHPPEDKRIGDDNARETIKELFQLDGAFVISDGGIFLSAARYIDAASEGIDLPLGLGSRHMAAASITRETNAVAVVVSESSVVRIFDDGQIISEIIPELWLLRRYSLHLAAPYCMRSDKELTVVSRTDRMSE